MSKQGSRTMTAKAINVIHSGEVFATIPIVDHTELRYAEREYAIEGVELRPASGKVFGGPRCRVYGLLYREGRWWTL